MAEIPMSTPDYGGPSGERPLGVTIIAILQLISAIILLVGGAGSLMIGLATLPFGFILLVVSFLQ